jgi:hypothetical protein
VTGKEAHYRPSTKSRLCALQLMKATHPKQVRAALTIPRERMVAYARRVRTADRPPASAATQSQLIALTQA